MSIFSGGTSGNRGASGSPTHPEKDSPKAKMRFSREGRSVVGKPMKDPKGIALILSKEPPKGKEGGMGDGDSDSDEGSDEMELQAMKEFDDAESPEERLSALKNIIKLCSEEY